MKQYYPKFLKTFPDWQTLAGASPGKILGIWQGLGYNRRALHLQKTAGEVIKKYDGKIPKNPDELAKLPGIGKATAGAILAYAYNIPLPYIETNVRRTFIHWFFRKKKEVDDRDILPFVEQTIDRRNPREWYWALMDYGTMLGSLKKENPNRKSKHYARQLRFEGSTRQTRGQVLKLLLKFPLTLHQLSRKTNQPQTILRPLLASLSREGFLEEENNHYRISR